MAMHKSWGKKDDALQCFSPSLVRTFVQEEGYLASIPSPRKEGLNLCLIDFPEQYSNHQARGKKGDHISWSMWGGVMGNRILQDAPIMLLSWRPLQCHTILKFLSALAQEGRCGRCRYLSDSELFSFWSNSNVSRIWIASNIHLNLLPKADRFLKMGQKHSFEQSNRKVV